MSQIAQHQPHHYLEDFQGIVTGVLLVALAIQFFRAAGLITGGTTGLAFLLHYSLQIEYGMTLFLINLPFYWFAIERMGWEFAIKTFCSVALLSWLSELMKNWLPLGHLDPFFAAIMGGLLAGVGILMLIRHKSSLAGVTVLALFLQQRFGWRAGKVQLGFDLMILTLGFFLVPRDLLLYSLVGAVALNAVIWVNHKPGRYMGM
ncbi:YitT family protein [Chitinibacter bivalviorum]|uniref:YitT family protein n=1 Tax=Chitinibacter bivalviorum TaxID=2739434 RepID=A0A7H9BI52_9NEIS|nr:YitT family protein [Chitinibacter bivalviorum]QLG87224.1 YitT family protein [Chitinibacter bivalviorum]